MWFIFVILSFFGILYFLYVVELNAEKDNDYKEWKKINDNYKYSKSNCYLNYIIVGLFLLCIAKSYLLGGGDLESDGIVLGIFILISIILFIVVYAIRPMNSYKKTNNKSIHNSFTIENHEISSINDNNILK